MSAACWNIRPALWIETFEVRIEIKWQKMWVNSMLNLGGKGKWATKALIYRVRADVYFKGFVSYIIFKFGDFDVI